MRKNSFDRFDATLLTLLLLPSMTAPMLLGCASVKDRVKVSAGVQYREFEKSHELEEKILDPERKALEPAMPGTSEVMQVGDQLPVLTLDLIFSPDFHFWSRDRLEGSLSLGYSTSAIFGGTERSKDIHAYLAGLDFGTTPTTFEQSLNHYFSAGLGGKYSPVNLGFGNFKIRIYVGGEAGISQVDSNSRFEFRVLDPAIFEQYGPDTRVTLHSLDIHQRSRTDANSFGWGKYVDGRLGLEFEYRAVSLLLELLHRYEIFPDLVIKRTRTVDPDRRGIYPEKEQVTHRTDEIEYSLGGTGITLKIQYQF